MSTLTVIQPSDLITNSRAVINANFAALNADKIETSVLDTDNTLAANSDAKIATQKATKGYVDAQLAVKASTTVAGIVEAATQAEVDAGTTTGATGALLFVGPATLPTGFAAVDSTNQTVTSTSETTIYTKTFAAGFFKTNNGIRFLFNMFATMSSGNSNVYTIRLKLGGTTISTIAYTASASTQSYAGNVQGFILNNNSLSAQKYAINGVLAAAGVVGSTGTTAFSQNDSSTATVDTSGSTVFAITIQGGGSSPSWTYNHLWIEKIGA